MDLHYRHLIPVNGLVPLHGHLSKILCQPVHLAAMVTLHLMLLTKGLEKNIIQATAVALQAGIGLHHGEHGTHGCIITALLLISATH